MRNICRKYKSVLLTILLIVVPILISLTYLLITKAIGEYSNAYPLIIAIFAGIYLFLSYLVGDLIIVRYKKKENIITSSVPEDVINNAKKYRYPFIFSFLALLIVFAVLALIYYLTGQWPFI